MAKPSKPSKPPVTPPLPMQDELKKIIQYIAQVYKLQKQLDEKLKALDKRISDLESNIKTVVEKSMAPLQSNIKTTIEKSIAPLQSNIKTTIEKSIAPLQSDLLEAMMKLFKTVITEEVLPQQVVAAPEPKPEPAPTPTPTEPEPPKTTKTPAEVQTPPSPPARRPSDIPDARISTVLEELENIIKELKNRQKVQREFLRPMLEEARDVAMNNLAARAVAARTFKELINLVKRAPFEVPPDIIKLVITKIEELSLHIRS